MGNGFKPTKGDVLPRQPDFPPARPKLAEPIIKRISVFMGVSRLTYSVKGYAGDTVSMAEIERIEQMNDCNGNISYFKLFDSDNKIIKIIHAGNATIEVEY